MHLFPTRLNETIDLQKALRRRWKTGSTYEGVSITSRTGRLEREQ